MRFKTIFVTLTLVVISTFHVFAQRQACTGKPSTVTASSPTTSIDWSVPDGIIVDPACGNCSSLTTASTIRSIKVVFDSPTGSETLSVYYHYNNADHEAKFKVAASYDLSSTITASQTTVCAGGTVRFTSSTGIGSANTHYNFLVNGISKQNTTSNIFDYSNLVNGDQVSMMLLPEMPASAVCYNVLLSNVITMSVYSIQSAVVQDRIILPNTNTNLTAGGAGTNETYKWYTGNNEYLLTGSTYSTPTLTQDAAYKVSVFNPTSGCESVEKAQLNVHINRPPQIIISPDQNLVLPMNSTSFNGTVTDSDGSVISLTWTQIAGPVIPLNGSNTATLTLNDLQTGNYTFQLLAIDNNSGTAQAEAHLSVIYPSNNYNWVKEEVFMVSGVTTPSVANSLPVGKKMITWSYLDGIGRPIQNVMVQNSPASDQKDIVQSIAYDVYGRENIKYLPYTSGNNGYFKSDFVPKENAAYATTVNPQYQFYQNTLKVDTDSKPYSETTFEPSPLNRVLKQGAPGAVWQPDTDIYSIADKTVKTRQELNADNEVLLFNYDVVASKVSVSTEVTEKYYGRNLLYANKTYDEKNNEVIEYIDKEGRTVCKKVYVETINGTKRFAETYYLYDDFGNLVAVFPPEGVEKAKTSLN